TIQVRIVGEVNLPHSARAQQRENVVVSQLTAYHLAIFVLSQHHTHLRNAALAKWLSIPNSDCPHFRLTVHPVSRVLAEDELEGNELISKRPSGETSYWKLA